MGQHDYLGNYVANQVKQQATYLGIARVVSCSITYTARVKVKV